MSGLSLTRVVSGATISSTTENNNQAAIEAKFSAGIDSDNMAADSITKTQLNSNVVNADNGLKQETDGSLSVDPSDTNPCLELSDGGLRVIADETTVERAAGGLQVKDGGISTDKIADNAITAAKLEDNITFDQFPSTPSGDPDADYEVTNKQYVDAQIAAAVAAVTKASLGVDSGSNSCAKDTDVSISFNFTYSSAPKVVATQVVATNSNDTDFAMQIKSVSTTGFVLRWHVGGDGGGGSPRTFNWIAVGTPA